MFVVLKSRQAANKPQPRKLGISAAACVALKQPTYRSFRPAKIVI